ncbi:hypothetical protein H4R21_006271, partial [Coemansia helicoidea]
VARRMCEMKISFSLIKERGKRIEQVEALLKAANVSTKAPLEIPELMSPGFDAHLMAIDLPIPPEFTAPASMPPQPPTQQPVHIQPLPVPPGAAAELSVVPVQPAAPGQIVPQKHPADTVTSPVEGAAAAKKAKTGPPAAAVEASPKAPRPKSKPKASAGGRKVPTAATSPAPSASVPVP